MIVLIDTHISYEKMLPDCKKQWQESGQDRRAASSSRTMLLKKKGKAKITWDSLC